MKIEIEYNGSLAKCTVNGTPFYRCDKVTRSRTLSAFHTIETEFYHDYKLFLAIRLRNS